MKRIHKVTCLTGPEHEIDLRDGSLEIDDGGDHACLSVPCSRCGAWAMISVEIVELVWGDEPDDFVRPAVPIRSFSGLN